MSNLFAILALLKVTLCIHHSMEENELFHIFGTRHKRAVPEYWLDNPKRLPSHSGEIFSVNYNGIKEEFLIKPHNRIFTEGFHMVVRDGENSTLSVAHPDENCVFQGHSLTRNGSSIAVVGCDDVTRGLIVDSAGDHFLIHPNIKGSDHIIHKRSSNLEESGHECLFDPKNDPFPDDKNARNIYGGKSSRLAVMRAEELTIELAVFADDAMWRHFNKLYGSAADVEIHRFILSAVNNIDILYSQRSIDPRINVKIVRYEVMKNPPPSLSKKLHRHGDVDKLLDNFCNYQHAINNKDDRDPRHWDHALLFSGYDLYRDGLRTVAGYAPVKGMCSGVRSCTINEGLDFGSVFVVTHEMGHSLGMYHDGDNECDMRCCIMSPSVGSGKTEWSRCSVNEFNVFVNNLGSGNRPPNCLVDSPSIETLTGFRQKRESPGQQFTLDEQCSIFHGQCWKHELRDGQELEEVCQMVWCGNGEGIIRTAHPALEGSYCGRGKWCRKGKCINTARQLPVINGGWSEFDDEPSNSCSPGCSECEIEGQIRLRRSTRMCNSPSPNNGGEHCNGDDSRGIRCKTDLCHGMTPDEYAIDFCTSLRDHPQNPNPQLSGEGLQFEQAMCKIWCQMANSNHIRTVANYPDGTPCGEGLYCLKGECRPLSCAGEAVLRNETDCLAISRGISLQKELLGNSITRITKDGHYKRRVNTYSLPTDHQIADVRVAVLNETSTRAPSTTTRKQFNVDRNYTPKTIRTGNTIVTRRVQYVEQTSVNEETTTTVPLYTSTFKSASSRGQGTTAGSRFLWTGWSEWSSCYGLKCQSSGIQVRARRCLYGNCAGARRQRKECLLECDDETKRVIAEWPKEEMATTTEAEELLLHMASNPVFNSSKNVAALFDEVSNAFVNGRQPHDIPKEPTVNLNTVDSTTRKRYIETIGYEGIGLTSKETKYSSMDEEQLYAETSRRPTIKPKVTYARYVKPNGPQVERPRAGGALYKFVEGGPITSENVKFISRGNVPLAANAPGALPPMEPQTNYPNAMWSDLPKAQPLNHYSNERWSEWSQCSTSCDRGRRTRQKINCQNAPCMQQTPCMLTRCATYHWTHWSDWSECQHPCTSGTQYRSRVCATRDQSLCIGATAESRPCTPEVCYRSWSEWTPYSQCSVSCGKGVAKRFRMCENDLQYCFGSNSETVYCDLPPCYPRDQRNSYIYGAAVHNSQPIQPNMAALEMVQRPTYQETIPRSYISQRN